MTIYPDIVAAIPASGTVSKSLTREALIKRYAYCLDDSEDLRTITVTDPNYGSIPLYVMQVRRLFQYDSTDSTTAHDGTTCLVSADGLRYKIDDFLLPWSVKSKTLTAPPGSPSIGDSYIVAAAATGAWSGHDGAIASYSSRGWLFTTMPEGRHVYNEADTAFYYLNAGGSWVSGSGSLLFSSHSVPLSALIGANASFILRVVNQTTNTPPVSPSVGDAYIIGGSPSGAWTGDAGKIAICEAASSWTIYTQGDGDIVYDLAQKLNFQWSSTSSAWVSASGKMKCVTHLFATPGTATFSKDSRSVMVKVTVIGGSGGAGSGSGNGGTSSFGSHISAPGSVACGSGGGAGGTGASGGDVNLPGGAGFFGAAAGDELGGEAGIVFGKYGRGVALGSGSCATGGGSAAFGWLLSGSIGTSETVTVGAGGTTAGGTVGNQGAVIVEEWVLT